MNYPNNIEEFLKTFGSAIGDPDVCLCLTAYAKDYGQVEHVDMIIAESFRQAELTARKRGMLS